MKETISGFGGRILRVNLIGSEIAKEPTEQYAKRFLGGRGINQWILIKEMKPWITPFEPASTLCFGAGALTGTLVPGASRINIDSKNPFTGGIASSSAGGWFASELKFAGFDNIVVKGKAKTPVYLWIDDEARSELVQGGNGSDGTARDLAFRAAFVRTSVPAALREPRLHRPSPQGAVSESASPAGSSGSSVAGSSTLTTWLSRSAT